MTNEEAINTLNSLKDYYNDKNEDIYVGFDNEDNEAINLAIKALEQARPKGKWKPLNYKDEMWGYVYKCSNCGAIEYGGDYCPGCGAEMEVESESNN